MSSPTAVEAKRILRRLACFLGLFIPIYMLLVVILSSVSSGGTTLMQRITDNPVDPGGVGHSLVRFRELEQAGKVDVLFVGSSHCYHSFDPRVFRDRGSEVFNMGSTNQTPLNTRYLLERYLTELSPRFVVMELSYPAMGNDGLESFFDLSVNVEFSSAIARMATALRKPAALNSLISTLYTRLRRPLAEVAQRPVDGQRYWPGGYSEMTTVLSDTTWGDYRDVEIRPEQLEHLRKAIELARERGGEVVLVVQPLPAGYLARIRNAGQVKEAIEAVARETGVTFVDFNEKMSLDPLVHYADEHHLNGVGAALFSEAVADLLQGQRREEGAGR